METRLSFVGRPSPPGFDRLGKTKDLMACISSGTPRYLVPRALNDTPCVAREGSGIVENFTREMNILCQEIDIPLADNGQLGVGFDSRNMSSFCWRKRPISCRKMLKRRRSKISWF